MNKEQIDHMVSRFLSWKLPKNFGPDAGISFNPISNEGTAFEYRHKPSGTNLFSHAQATEMVKHMVEGLPAPAQQQASAGEVPGFPRGALVEKINGPEWRGKVVGYYSSSFTPEGLVIECVAEGARGQVHVEPAKRMRLVTVAKGGE